MSTPFIVEYLDPQALEPSPQNFRRHPAIQKQALSSSLEEFGWLAAPIINRRGMRILDGHARVELALEREEATVPCRVIDVDAAQEQRILASFDRIGSLAERDDQALASLLQELSESEAGLPAGWGEDDLAALLAELGPVTGGSANGLVAADDPDSEFYSPVEVIEAARRVMGGIDLDPASCAAADARVRAQRYFTAAEDGLLQEWDGRVWINPPFFAGSYERWFAKLCAEHTAERVSQSCLLMPVSDGRWFHDLLQYPVCFLFHRQSFFTPAGDLKEPLRYGCVVSYQGPEAARFYKEFEALGTTLRRVSGQSAVLLEPA
jgi:hypothetical protein